MAILGPFNFSGGYSPAYDFYALPSDHQYASSMSNCSFKNGAIYPRWGTRFIDLNAGLGGTVRSLKVWNDIANSKLALVATVQTTTKLYIADITGFIPESSTANFIDRTGALAASSINSSTTTFDSLNNILVGSSNSASSGVLFKVTAYNANGAALGGSPPSGDVVKQCNNFLFIARNLSSTTTQSNVYWSNVNDPETWTGTNVLAFNKNDGEPIMALGSIGTDLYIFKQNSIGRLSTVTITVSGAVTLGPLVTVIRGVGCCGPRALDNLPNGNIVFWGFDGHFYEFDGSTVIDRSKQPYPGPNVYGQSIWNTTSQTRDMGLRWMLNDTSSFVKVNRGTKEVYVTASSTLLADNAETTLVYDFEQNVWQGDTDFNTIGSGSIYGRWAFEVLDLSLQANGSPQESNQILLFDSFSGSRVACSGNSTRPYPYYPGSSTSIPFQVGKIIRLLDEKGPIIPLSLCIETSQTNTSNATLGSFLVYADYDTYLPSTVRYTGTAGAQLPARLIITIPFRQDSIGTNVFPSYLSILIRGTGQGTTNNVPPEIIRIGNIWVSDEVMR